MAVLCFCVVFFSEPGKFDGLSVDFEGIFALGMTFSCLVLVLPWLYEVFLLVDAGSVSCMLVVPVS
jgi:hypothetical protein